MNRLVFGQAYTGEKVFVEPPVEEKRINAETEANPPCPTWLKLDQTFPLLLHPLSFVTAGRERGRGDSLDVAEEQSCLLPFHT